MKARSFEEFFGYVISEIGKISKKDAQAFYNKIVKESASKETESTESEETNPNE